MAYGRDRQEHEPGDQHDVPLAVPAGLVPNLFEYDLPRWTHKVIKVREDSGTGDRSKGPIMQGSLRSNQPGWAFFTNKTIKVAGYSTAKDLIVSICKQPARLQAGTSPAAGTANTLVLEALSASFVYEEDAEADAYANAVFEITGPITTGPDRNPTGQIRRVTSSARSQPVAVAEVRTTVTLETNWTVTPAQNDTYEMHAEVDDAHIRYLVLMTAQYCWQKHQNVGAIQSISGEMREEHDRFVTSARDRMSHGPLFWNQGEDDAFADDPDRAALLGTYGYGYGFGYIY
jgi:hypothetical protein